MLNVVMQNVALLNVVMLNVTMLIVRYAEQGILTEGEGSVRLTSMY
jgi:hypothetical protein